MTRAPLDPPKLATVSDSGDVLSSELGSSSSLSLQFSSDIRMHPQ
jgi:hypothetical protein